MSDPTLSDIDFKNKMVWTILNTTWYAKESSYKFVKTAQESVKTGHVYLNIYSDQADGEIGIIASMFKEMADAFSQIEGEVWLGLAMLT